MLYLSRTELYFFQIECSDSHLIEQLKQSSFCKKKPTIFRITSTLKLCSLVNFRETIHVHLI